MSKPTPMGGPMVWGLIIREHFEQPATAMRLLRVAECGAKARANLAVDAWCAKPESLIEALSTLRSAPAVLAALKRLGWDETTPDPSGGIARLRAVAGFGHYNPIEQGTLPEEP
jgi:hypothetical protein